MDKRTGQTTIYKTLSKKLKVEENDLTRTGDEHWCFERVSSFNLEINPGIHHNTTQKTQD